MTSITFLETPSQSTKKRKGEGKDCNTIKRNNLSGFKENTLCQIKIELGLPFLDTMTGRNFPINPQIEILIGEDFTWVPHESRRIEDLMKADYSIVQCESTRIEDLSAGDDTSAGMEWIINGLAWGRIHLFNHNYKRDCFTTGKYRQYRNGVLYESVLDGCISGAFVRKIGYWEYYYSNDTSPTLPRIRRDRIKGNTIDPRTHSDVYTRSYLTNMHLIACQSRGNYIMGKRHGVWETFTRDGLLDRVLYYNEGVKIEGADVHTAILNNFPLFFPNVLYNSIIKDYTGIECDDFTLTEGDPYHTDLN